MSNILKTCNTTEVPGNSKRLNFIKYCTAIYPAPPINFFPRVLFIQGNFCVQTFLLKKKLVQNLHRPDSDNFINRTRSKIVRIHNTASQRRDPQSPPGESIPQTIPVVVRYKEIGGISIGNVAIFYYQNLSFFLLSLKRKT
jgi:hypothetical protein